MRNSSKIALHLFIIQCFWSLQSHGKIETSSSSFDTLFGTLTWQDLQKYKPFVGSIESISLK